MIVDHISGAPSAMMLPESLSGALLEPSPLKSREVVLINSDSDVEIQRQSTFDLSSDSNDIQEVGLPIK